MTNAERLRRHRRKVAREKKLANPKLKAKQARRAERERALAGRILALPGKRYGVIYGDPEWRDEVWGRETGLDRAPDNHYATSPDEIIKSRPVETIAAKDCVLFLWSTVQHLAVAIEVMQKRGFEYKIACHVGVALDQPRPLDSVASRGLADRNARQDPLSGARNTMGELHRLPSRRAQREA